MIQKLFQTLFNSEPIIIRAPGSIHLMGDHVDYHDGLMLSVAIDRYAHVAISRRTDGDIHLFDKQANEYCSMKAEDLKPDKKGWTCIVTTVLRELIKRGYSLSGFNMLLDSSITPGCGMSSKMAQTVAITTAFNESFQLHLSRFGTLLVCQAVHEAITGEDFGIMQAYPHVFGKSDSALKMDCSKSEYRLSSFSLRDHKILLLNPVYYNHAYQDSCDDKRAKSSKSLKRIHQYHPTVTTLTALTKENIGCLFEPRIKQQAEYFIQEFGRVHAAIDSLESDNIENLGALMFTAHKHFIQLSNAGSTKSNWLVDSLMIKPGVIGARMQAGVYGGSVVAICKEECLPALIKDLSGAYKLSTGSFLKTIELESALGVQVVNKNMTTSIN